jgi:hypothetical protein
MPRQRRQRKRQTVASRWRRLLVEIFEPRQLLAPLAVADSYSTPEDTLLSITAPGILANDTGGAVSATLQSAPARGTLNLNASGEFRYIPGNDFFGLDSFTYRASDGTSPSNIATVIITVLAVNDPPVAANDSYAVEEGASINLPAPGILANDFDLDSAVLTARLLAGPSHGVLTLRPDGSFDYAAGCYYGYDSFTYEVSDGQAVSWPANVSIYIYSWEGSPVWASDDTFTTGSNILRSPVRASWSTITPRACTVTGRRRLNCSPAHCTAPCRSIKQVVLPTAASQLRRCG